MIEVREPLLPADRAEFRRTGKVEPHTRAAIVDGDCGRTRRGGLARSWLGPVSCRPASNCVVIPCREDSGGLPTLFLSLHRQRISKCGKLRLLLHQRSPAPSKRSTARK